MTEEIKKLSVWFFVGILISVNGLAVLGSGIYGLFVPTGLVLSHLHPSLWWGILMVLFGGFFIYKHRPVRVKAGELGG